MSKLLTKSRSINPFPSGTIIAGLGFLISGLAAYGFLSIASHHLTPEEYSPLATFWAMLWILAPGFFYPLEQEIGRATAARRAMHIGVRPLIIRAALIGFALFAVLIIALALFAFPIANELFSGHISLVIALGLALLAYLAEYTMRGVLAGNGLFNRYSMLVSLEGFFRIAPVAIVIILGVATTGVLGIILAAAALLATVLAPIGAKNLAEAGPHSPWNEISNALGFLLLASFCNQFLTYAGAVAIRLLSSPTQHSAAGVFLNGLVVARIPLFLFQAIQAALLPQLSSLLGKGDFNAYRKAFMRLFLVVIGIGIIGTLGFLVLGPWVVTLFFGHAYGVLSHTDMGLLALASAFIMVGLTLTQSLLSLGHYGYAALAWFGGTVAFLIMVLLTPHFGLFFRVELALAVGCAVTVIIAAASYLPQLGSLESRASTFLKKHPAPSLPEIPEESPSIP